MKKGQFWSFLLAGIFCLTFATVLVVFTGDGTIAQAELGLIWSFITILLGLGAFFSFTAGAVFLKGEPRDYLLEGKEYEKVTEIRYDSGNKPEKKVELLLRKSSEGKSFDSIPRFHLIPADQLRDEDGRMIEKLPETFLVKRDWAKEDQNYRVYLLIETRTY